MMIQKRKRIILNFPIDTNIKDLVNVIIEKSSDPGTWAVSVATKSSFSKR